MVRAAGGLKTNISRLFGLGREMRLSPHSSVPRSGNWPSPGCKAFLLPIASSDIAFLLTVMSLMNYVKNIK
jgi:hypothetical protein